MSKGKFESILYPLCIVLLLASNVFIVWKYKGLQSEAALRAPGVSPTTVRTLLDTPMPTTTGDTVTLAQEEEKSYLVLFLFSIGDCPSCIEELAGLGEIQERRIDIGVYGMVSYSSVSEAMQILGLYGVDFPLLQDPEGAMFERFKFPKTPWKIVVHRASGKILFEDPPSNTEAEREAFLTRITSL